MSAEPIQEAIYVTAEELKFEAAVLGRALELNRDRYYIGKEWLKEAKERYNSAEEIYSFSESLKSYANLLLEENSYSELDPLSEFFDHDDQAPLENSFTPHKGPVRDAMYTHHRNIRKSYSPAEAEKLDLRPLEDAMQDYQKLKHIEVKKHGVDFIDLEEDALVYYPRDEDAAFIQN